MSVGTHVPRRSPATALFAAEDSGPSAGGEAFQKGLKDLQQYIDWARP
ncbi:hypothetical protein ACWGE1_02645 [Streptomyces sp. NPDC054932]